MTFDELVQEVYDQTSRPDLVVKTEAAIKAATIKAHNLEFWDKDWDWFPVDLGAEETLHQLNYRAEVAQFREFKTVFRLVEAGDTEGRPIDIITVEGIFDEYGAYRTDIAYKAGATLNIRSAVAFQYANVGAFVTPVVSPKENYVSWVALDYPYAIAYEAARRILKTIGKDQDSSSMKELVAEEYRELTVGATIAAGF